MRRERQKPRTRRRTRRWESKEKPGSDSGGAGMGGGEGREPPQRDRSCWMEKTEVEPRAAPWVQQRGYSPAWGGNAEGGLEAKDGRVASRREIKVGVGEKDRKKTRE